MLGFIDSARFMASLLSNLVNYLSERIHGIKYKYKHDDKKSEIDTVIVFFNILTLKTI